MEKNNWWKLPWIIQIERPNIITLHEGKQRVYSAEVGTLASNPTYLDAKVHTYMNTHLYIWIHICMQYLDSLNLDEKKTLFYMVTEYCINN